MQSFRHALRTFANLVQLASADNTGPRPKPNSGRVAYSCVIDNDPVLLAQGFIWVNCLLDLQSVPGRDVFVHLPAAMPAPELMSWLASRGVNLVPIEPFDGRNPYCNKLRQLDTFQQGRFDQVVDLR